MTAMPAYPRLATSPEPTTGNRSHDVTVLSDLEQFDQFIRTLHRPDSIVQLTALDRVNGGAINQWMTTDELVQKFGTWKALNEVGHCIYVSVNPRRHKGAMNKGSAKSISVLFVDDDGKTDDEAAQDALDSVGLPTPSLFWFTGHGYQSVFALDEAFTDAEEAESYQRGLASLLCSDTTVCDDSRLCRPPGFMNWKRPDSPVRTRLISAEAVTPYSRADLLSLIHIEDHKNEQRLGTESERGLSVQCNSVSVQSVGVSVQSVSVQLSVWEDADLFDQAKGVFDTHLPRIAGSRNETLHRIARKLKGIKKVADLPAVAFEPFMRAWHAEAVRVVSTKEWSESWSDFCRSWDSVLVPHGQGVVFQAFAESAGESNPPFAEQFPSSRVQHLIRLCVNLQRRAGNAPFYLSLRMVMELFGVKIGTASAWLRALIDAHVLDVVQQHTPARARRFKCRGNQ
jgi:hypothetical protein